MKSANSTFRLKSGRCDVFVHRHARERAALRLDECPPISWWQRVARGIVDRQFEIRNVRDNGCHGYVVPCVDQSGAEVDLLVAAKRMHTGDGDYAVHMITVYPIAVDGEAFREWLN